MMFYAFAFWWGSHASSQRGNSTFTISKKSLWALGFCAAGAGQGAAFAGDANAAGRRVSHLRAH